MKKALVIYHQGPVYLSAHKDRSMPFCAVFIQVRRKPPDYLTVLGRLYLLHSPNLLFGAFRFPPPKVPLTALRAYHFSTPGSPESFGSGFMRFKFIFRFLLFTTPFFTFFCHFFPIG
jgi:hypothetical protein